MRTIVKCLTIFLLMGYPLGSIAIEVERFEKLNTPDGLSQSSVVSSFCDSRGFLWFGTMDGLNRYDGYSFHVYRKKPNDPFSLTNNRIIKIWEDSNQFIWVESHDGHYHCLDVTTDRFFSFPKSTEISDNRNVRITSFCETNGKEIWLGTDFSGIYRLTLNESGTYDYQHFGSKGINSVSNGKINFIYTDEKSGLWIGTENGVNLVKKEGQNNELNFQHFLIDHSFTAAITLNGKIWFGTRNKGLVSYDLQSTRFEPEPIFPGNIQITVLKKTKSGNLVVGTNSGLFVYNPIMNQTFSYFKHQTINRIYEDRLGVLWLVTDKRGISRLNLNTSVEQYFQLVPEKLNSLILNERQVLFEDAEGNIWIGSHGGGLALFDSEKSTLGFFRNNPDDEFTISSDVVYCITQDKSGLIWVGTGQSIGGLNKVVLSNPLFKHIRIKGETASLIDNIAKALFQDTKNNTWVATKSGSLYVYDQSFKLLHDFTYMDSNQSNIPESNIYSIMQDNEGYIWLGSKGSGVAVSQLPFNKYDNYNKIRFNRYENNPDDNSSLNSDNVYTIIQDNSGIIWIGTFGGGINIVQTRTPSKLTCIQYNTKNSNLTSNEIRQVVQDKNKNIWIATTYGLNMVDNRSISDSARFVSFVHDPSDPKSLSYNDIIYIYEDSRNRLWFGTSGGGVNYFSDPQNYRAGFNHLTVENGLINDAVLGIAGDSFGNIWFSTQNGISSYNPENNKFENFDANNGLVCSDFSENSCTVLNSGRLIFGNTSGLLVITPNTVASKKFSPPVCLTNFLLFNKEVKLNDEKSPISKNINYTDEVFLRHDQSSFSFEYAALSYLDPKKNQYSYTLENFDDTWYNVKNERKATYTNIPPGEYVFKVKASNWDGTWNENPKEIKINILSPWWKTNIALLGYLILSVIVFLILRNVYSNYHRLQTDLKVEKRVNEIKLQFFTDISHEIRTPLTLILGPLDDIKKIPNLPAALTNPLNIMNRNGKRILRLVNQLLDFRKIQNQKMMLAVQHVELNQFINEICQNFNHLAFQRNITFIYPEGRTEQFAWIDKEKMDAVLFNIVSNAFKFTKDGKSIKVSVQSSGDFHSIIIEDQGKGISGDELPFIFKRFNTITANVDFSGSGIGLAYSYELIKLHNGEITVESTPGEGSRFTLLIPMGKDHFSQENAVFIDNKIQRNYSHAGEYDIKNLQETTPVKKGSLKNHKIVIVEDNTEVIKYLESILEKSYHIYHAANGFEGLKLIYDIHPDLVITDLMMPEMDGLTMTKKIKQDFAISHIPVVMLTAKSGINDQIVGIETGAEAYVMKPFNSEYLETVINNLLKQRDILSKKYHSETFSDQIKITNRDEEFIRSTISIIEKHCQDPEFTVNELISKSNLGRTVFFNKIKGLTGLSPVEFIRNIKLQIAGKHLRENNCGVAEAAYLSGFNDVKYFTTCFTKEFGMNPSKYKKQQALFSNRNN